MSTLTERFTLRLPDHWTPEQALAVYELLKELAGAGQTRFTNGRVAQGRWGQWCWRSAERRLESEMGSRQGHLVG